MVIVRAGLSNPLAIMSQLSYDKVLAWFMYNKEKSHLECDRVTRETGNLTKMVVVIDLNHTSWSGNDGGFSKANGESSNIGEFLYPQLLQCSVMINIPSTFRLFFPVLKMFFSAKTLAKLKVCPARTTSGEQPIAVCPHAAMLANFEELPTFLGGTCPRTINGIPNEQTKPSVPLGEDGMQAITVLNRDTYDVFAEIPEGGGVVLWRLKIEDGRGVEMSAVVKVPQEGKMSMANSDAMSGAAEVLPVMAATKLRGNDSEGEIRCEAPGGLLVITFSNEHSWWNTKEVRYSLEVKPL